MNYFLTKDCIQIKMKHIYTWEEEIKPFTQNQVNTKTNMIVLIWTILL